VVLNKVDMLDERGIRIDVSLLSHRLGVPVVQMQAHRRVGLDELKRTLVEVAGLPVPTARSPLPSAFCEEVTTLQRTLKARLAREVPRYLVERLLLDVGGYVHRVGLLGNDSRLIEEVRAARDRLLHADCPVPAIETKSRYQWVDRVLEGVIERPAEERVTLTDRIDGILTHRVGGSLIFAVLMVVVFQAIFTWAQPLQELLEKAVTACSNAISHAIAPGMLQSLLADGVIAGVGAVLAFLPQIAMLFLFIGILEECGYMARAAYLMDAFMARVGLSGKAFIPLLSSFACAVPGILATRVIEDRRDRLITILVAPLMSCSARLPVYTLLIAAFIPNHRFLGGWLGLQGITIVALYLLGIIVAIGVAKILKLTLLKGETPPFVMELPDYRVPSIRTVVSRVGEQCWTFVRNAGTIILAVTVVVWAAAYFPRNPELETSVRAQFAGELARLDGQLQSAREAVAQSPDSTDAEQLQTLQQQREELETTISNRVAGALMEQSILGHLGRLIEPLVHPLGWDWRIGCSVIASFPAREVVIGAMGVIYNLGEGQDEESSSLKHELITAKWPDTGSPIFTIPVALSIMVFFSLCAQCSSTLVIIRRETGELRWSVFTFVYMTLLAYVGALLTYQIGTWISG
jgi:ferrous iron transport protein B